MDKEKYEALRKRIGNLDIPTPKTDEKFRLHIQFSAFSGDYADAIINLLDTLDARKAVRGCDYLICAYRVEVGHVLVIHTNEEWACTEDITCKYEETWL